MKIKNMFVDDINRRIGGVVKVGQADIDIINQEVSEYVITKELKKHFNSFFDYYSESFHAPTDDVGVWISGFFGSGKSHFLKMLSYVLENKPVCGTTTVEKFREKFADDPATFMAIDSSTRGETETILFNIDAEGAEDKTSTAVFRVFRRMFFSHLGFYGKDLRVAKLEQYIAKEGKTEEFKNAYKEARGKDWDEDRNAFGFRRTAVAYAMSKALNISVEDATHWYNDKNYEEYSIRDFAYDVKQYIDTKPNNFRLVFLADEVGQYIGTDCNRLLNLQTIVEEIGTICGGKVWIICAGQQAIDEIIKVRADEFSRIQARFKTRLSLSSSSVDEVIQKRILKKNSVAKECLTSLYASNDSVLRNLFSFSTDVKDIKGYSNTDEYIANYPFVPYQFILMQKVFAEIRKHGNAGQHLSGGERSMLSGFQEAAQKIQDKDEFSLAPFYLFYDTVHGFLDVSIRNVIERCQRAAENHNGVEAYDVDLLKLLYLIRYVNKDIPATLDNLVILMADSICVDKITLKEKIRASLERLLSQNYVGRIGNAYNFLTDEEQDAQREIKNTQIDSSSIINRIGNVINSEIYTSRKFKYEKYDFPFTLKVDNFVVGASNDGIQLCFLTAAVPDVEKSDLRLMGESQGNKAIIVLDDTNYYETIESALKIRKYAASKNIPNMPSSMQSIIRSQQELATNYERSTTESLKKAIENAKIYASGERLDVTGDAKSKIDQALEYLVTHVYSDLHLIEENADSEQDIKRLLEQTRFSTDGTVLYANHEAASKIEEYLQIQSARNFPVTMADIQDRYQKIPYGWREIDIAAVVALLVKLQKITIKYNGEIVKAEALLRSIDILRKKTEVGKTVISIRQIINIQKINQTKAILREYFEIQDVPSNEDSLVKFIVDNFTEKKNHYESLKNNYRYNSYYPGKDTVNSACELVDSILFKKNDNFALIDSVIASEDDLFDNKEEMQNVEEFFRNQVSIFNEAYKLEEELCNEIDYFNDPEEKQNAEHLIQIVKSQGNFNYREIPQLHGLVAIIKDYRERLLQKKRQEVSEFANQCLEFVVSEGTSNTSSVVEEAKLYYGTKQNDITNATSLLSLDGYIKQLGSAKDNYYKKIDAIKANNASDVKITVKKNIKHISRELLCPPRVLGNKSDIDGYVEEIRERLQKILSECEGIDLR